MKKKNPKLLRIHKTYPIKKLLIIQVDNGDLTQVKTISNFKKDVLKSKKYANLITTDGGFEWNDENYQEQEAYIDWFRSNSICIEGTNKRR